MPVSTWKLFQTARPTDDNLRSWFGNGRRRNIGIPTGALSGIIAIDCDSPAAITWADDHLPPTEMRTRTARGEHRIYRRDPNGADVRNTVHLRTDDPDVTIDVRGDGGYIVAPGSEHASGTRYERLGTWPPVDQLPTFDPAWVATEGHQGPTSGNPDRVPGKDRTSSDIPQDLETRLRGARAYLRATPPAIQGQGGDTHTYQVVCRIVRGFDLSEADARDVLAEWNRTCVPPWSERELDEKIAGALKYGTEPIGARAEERRRNITSNSDGARVTGTSEAQHQVTDFGNLDRVFPNTDSGNAEYFADRHGHELRYDHQRGRWLHWSPPIWTPDADARVRRLAKAAMRQRFRDTEHLDDLDARKQAARWAITSESRPRLDALLYLAQAEEPTADAGTGWDSDPFLIACPNGVVDLKTGRLRAGRPADQLTMQTTVPFDPTATCPRFEQFLVEVFAGDRDLIAYLHRVVGYGLTGDTSEQCFWMPYGAGSNGKSTLLRVLTRVLGSYAYTAPFSTFMKDHRPSISNDLAALAGRRFVCASEADENARLNEGRLKSLTGGDEITARFLNHEFFTYTPRLKLWLAVNHRPVVKDDSHGMWRRVRVIPFTQRFTVNPTLESKLFAEAHGILAWAVRGCLLWLAEGLQTPSTVLAATTDYEVDSDPLSDFLSAACTTSPEAEVGASELFKHYTSWADQNGWTARERLSATMFGRKLTERFSWTKTKAGKVYLGVQKHAEVTGLAQ